MKLIVINGSPKGKGSNTTILTSKFLKGFLSIEGNSAGTFYLKSLEDQKSALQIFTSAEVILIAFPLYTDSMPGIVKEFIESLEKLKGVNPELKIFFLVQSGFPESNHSLFIARYLEKLTKRLEIKYAGTIIKGGVEGIKIKPSWMVKRLTKNLEKLGFIFGKSGMLDEKILKRLAKPSNFSGLYLLFASLLGKAGMFNYYWDMQLKKNNAFQKRVLANGFDSSY